MYQCQRCSKQEQCDEVGRLSSIVCFLKFTTKPVKKYHVEEKGETNLTEEEEAGDQTPDLSVGANS